MRSVRLRCTASALLAGLLAGGAPTRAADEPAPAAESGTVYNVELLIFRVATASGGAEDWGAASSARSVAGEESESGSGQVGHFVAALPQSDWQLGELENRLRASGTWVPVAHTAWSQTASAWGTHAGFPVQKLGISVPGLSGTVALERGQFLHLGLALAWSMSAPPSGLGAAPDTTFTLNENRRIRFYDRGYFDNPAFGVIALVTPAQGARPPGR